MYTVRTLMIASLAEYEALFDGIKVLQHSSIMVVVIIKNLIEREVSSTDSNYNGKKLLQDVLITRTNLFQNLEAGDQQLSEIITSSTYVFQ